METPHWNLIESAVGLIAGGVVGLAFGYLQNAAFRRHQKLQQEGKFKSGWAIMPGSFRRIAYLLVALALVQWVCPVLFTPGGPSQWFVSAGVVFGYGWTLYGQLRRRLA
jgi:hypothetical protein